MVRSAFILLFLSLSFGVVRAQYISEVLSYTPAPGQFINSAPWGTPGSAQSIVGGVSGSLCLGAFGGSVVFRFESAIENHPDNPYGVDFTIFGNPMAQWSEPGVVFVMEDENGNGEADDTWYELAGSDHFFSSTRRNFSTTYFNPDQSEAADVPWETQEGKEGFIRANSVHLQAYYPLPDSFPGIGTDETIYTGTLLEGAVDVDHPPLLISGRRAFGYADNQVRGSAPYTLPDNPYTAEVENSGGDAFDIDWAIDNEGSYVELERIHFVKVQSGILHEGGFLGEVSTEITGAVDVAPAPGIHGNTVQLVIKDLPPEMDATPMLMEAFLFHYGSPVEGSSIRWTCSEEWARVDEENHLRMTGSGPLTISARVDEEPQLEASVSTLVSMDLTSSTGTASDLSRPVIFPNPAGESFRVYGVDGVRLTLYDVSGHMLKNVAYYREGMMLACDNLLPGIYMLKLGDEKSSSCIRLLKR